MRVLILKSSGNKHGSSAMLADEFARGAAEAGHEVSAYDVARADIRPCIGCNACGMAGGCGTPDMTRATSFPDAAYQLGRSL